MQILVIGSGSIARRHVQNIRALCPEAAITLLSRRSGAGADLGDVRVIDDLAKALNPAPQLAVLANPSAEHAKTLVPLIQAQVPIYIEKPVATSREGIALIREALKRSTYRAPTLAGCNLRFLPSLRKMREIAASGVLGTVVRASFEVGQWLPEWRPTRDYRHSYSADAGQGGGVVFDLIHELDAARWFFGEFDEVLAMTGQYSQLEIKSEDTASVLLRARGRAPIVQVSLDYVSRRPVRRYQIVGDEATLVWDLFGKKLELRKPDSIESVDCGEAGFDTGATYRTAMVEMLDSVRSGKPTSQDISEGIASAELALRIREEAGA